MTDSQIQAKLNQLTKIANELNLEAKHRYGGEGNLFFESAGQFHLMDGDAPGDYEGGPAVRQEHIRFTSTGYCRMGSGAW